MNESPLGAAALAGTSFPIDREMTAALLGFDRPMANSLDAVADRDFALEFLSASSLCAMHLSRLAEELVIWSSAQFRFRDHVGPVFDRVQHHAAEEEPGCRRTGAGQDRADHGATVGLFTVMKGLPLAYSKDMQEDKEQVFDAADSLMLSLAAMAGMVGGYERQSRGLAGGGLFGVFHRDRSGRLAGARGGVALPRGASCDGQPGGAGREGGQRPARTDAGSDEIRSHEAITIGVFDVLGVDNSVKSRTSYGGTAPDQVRVQIARWKERLA